MACVLETTILNKQLRLHGWPRAHNRPRENNRTRAHKWHGNPKKRMTLYFIPPYIQRKLWAKPKIRVGGGSQKSQFKMFNMVTMQVSPRCQRSSLHQSKFYTRCVGDAAHILDTHAKDIKLSLPCQSFSAIVRHELEAEHTGGAELTASHISHQQINTWSNNTKTNQSKSLGNTGVNFSFGFLDISLVVTMQLSPRCQRLSGGLRNLS